MNVIEANGARIPAMGLGTMTLKDAVCVEAVKKALQLGYRHIDTAQNYGNEREVGEGIRASGVKREDVFLTTKIYWNRLNEFERAVDESLKALGFPSVDLLLIHWASPQIPVAQSVTTLCTFKRKGLARHVGVANFTTRDARRSRAGGDRAAGHQPDRSASVPRPDQGRRRLPQAWPVGDGLLPAGARQDPERRYARSHRRRRTARAPSQVALRYLVQQGIIPIPRTANPDHLAANLAVFDFKLSDEEMAAIGRLKRADARVVNPPHAPAWDA